MSRIVRLNGFFHAAGLMPTQSLVVTGYYDYLPGGIPVLLNAEFGLVKPDTKILLKEKAVRKLRWAN